MNELDQVEWNRRYEASLDRAQQAPPRRRDHLADWVMLIPIAMLVTSAIERNRGGVAIALTFVAWNVFLRRHGRRVVESARRE